MEYWYIVPGVLQTYDAELGSYCETIVTQHLECDVTQYPLTSNDTRISSTSHVNRRRKAHLGEGKARQQWNMETLPYATNLLWQYYHTRSLG